MYTMLDDKKHAKTIIDYMQNNPNCSIKELSRKCFLCRARIKSLEKMGYFELPKWSYNKELDKRFENRNYVSVTVGREYGKWIGY